jgi:hypothetical protein
MSGLALRGVISNTMERSGSEFVAQYPDLRSAIQETCFTWCDAHGYSDPFCRNGEWWAFPPQSVMPVRIKTVMGMACQYPVKIGPVTLTIYPDGSLASAF